MYGLFAYIYHKNQPNVGIYIYMYHNTWILWEGIYLKSSLQRFVEVCSFFVFLRCELRTKMMWVGQFKDQEVWGLENGGSDSISSIPPKQR